MHTIIKRFHRSTLLFCAAFSAAGGALAYTPSTAAAQVTCYVCACEGGRCVCQPVACPAAVQVQ